MIGSMSKDGECPEETIGDGSDSYIKGVMKSCGLLKSGRGA